MDDLRKIYSKIWVNIEYLCSIVIQSWMIQDMWSNYLNTEILLKVALNTITLTLKWKLVYVFKMYNKKVCTAPEYKSLYPLKNGWFRLVYGV